MAALRRLIALFTTLTRGTRQDRDLDEELRAYLEHRIAQRVARGATPA